VDENNRKIVNFNFEKPDVLFNGWKLESLKTGSGSGYQQNAWIRIRNLDSRNWDAQN
jgi:hypothetical protein